MEKAWVNTIKDSCFPQLLSGGGGSKVLLPDHARKEVARPREALRSRPGEFGHAIGDAHLPQEHRAIVARAVTDHVSTPRMRVRNQFPQGNVSKLL